TGKEKQVSLILGPGRLSPESAPTANASQAGSVALTVTPHDPSPLHLAVASVATVANGIGPNALTNDCPEMAVPPLNPLAEGAQHLMYRGTAKSGTSSRRSSRL